MNHDSNAYKKLMRSLLTDASAREAFLKDPKAALEKATGEKVPEGVEIVVHEAKEKQHHIVLPPLMTAGSFSDDQLDQVAGGSGPTDKGCWQTYKTITCCP